MLETYSLLMPIIDIFAFKIYICAPSVNKLPGIQMSANYAFLVDYSPDEKTFGTNYFVTTKPVIIGFCGHSVICSLVLDNKRWTVIRHKLKLSQTICQCILYTKRAH